jgi:hypothetical protein
MPAFKAPIYTKVAVEQGAAPTACYTFAVEYLASDNEDHLSSIAEQPSDLSVEKVTSLVTENNEWWGRFIQSFMTASAKHFSKKYSLEQLSRITRHVLSPITVESYPVNANWSVEQIKIYGGLLYIHWTIETAPFQIDLPETPQLSPRTVVSTAPVSQMAGVSALPDELEEVDIETMPVKETPATAMNPTQEYDRQRVKESRLKAKLALYKAQYQMRLYYEKYGKECSDSDSDVDSEWEEEEEDEAYEEEEDVQL